MFSGLGLGWNLKENSTPQGYIRLYPISAYILYPVGDIGYRRPRPIPYILYPAMADIGHQRAKSYILYPTRYRI